MPRSDDDGGGDGKERERDGQGAVKECFAPELWCSG